MMIMKIPTSRTTSTAQELARLTAAYQAVCYLGFAAPFLLAAIAHAVPASELLIAVAVLATLTLVWTTRNAMVTLVTRKRLSLLSAAAWMPVSHWRRLTSETPTWQWSASRNILARGLDV